MNIEQLTELLALLKSTSQEGQCDLIGDWVIVRSHSSGVHFGRLKSKKGNEVTLKDSRRMWRWWSASENSLSGVARHGINREKSKICGPLKTIVLPEVCEIIPVGEECRDSIFGAPIYNEQ